MKRNKVHINVACGALLVCAMVSTTAVFARDRGRTPDPVQTGVTQVVTIKNFGNRPLRDIDISFSGADADDFSQTNDCGRKLDVGASCNISVNFSPKTPGNKSSIMEVNTSGGNQSVPLTGTGT